MNEPYFIKMHYFVSKYILAMLGTISIVGDSMGIKHGLCLQVAEMHTQKFSYNVMWPLL